MKNTKNQFVISLSSDMLCAARVSKGRVIQSERLDLDPDMWANAWSDGLLRFDQPLRQLLSRFSSRLINNAVVMYQSSSVTQQVHAFDLDTASARAAGIAKIRESIGFRDSVQTHMLSECGSRSKTSMALVYSEREDQLRSLYAWLNRCNVSVKALVPTSVSVMSTASRIALKAEPDTAVVYIGSDVCAMAFANEEGLQLVRIAQIGYRKLAEAYMTGLSVGEDQGGDSGLEHEPGQDQVQGAAKLRTAVGMLFEHGIPMDSKEVGGIDLRQVVLPALAPVLQTLCIEIKQTFRFGLSGLDMPKNIQICGPGASIPCIGKSLGQHIDMYLQVDEHPRGEVVEAFGEGTVEYAMVSGATRPSGLLPELALDERFKKKLNRGLAVGAALVAVGIGAEYADTVIEQQEIKAMMGSEASRLRVINDFEEQCSLAQSMSSAICDVSELVSDTVIDVPRWGVMLEALGKIDTESVRIQQIRGEYKQGSPFIDINGLAVSAGEQEAGQALSDFVGSIEEVEGVFEVKLGAISRVRVGEDGWGRQFVLKVELAKETLPHELVVRAQVDSATDTTGGAP